jgi:molybdopterin synthase catalytic subunit
MGKSVCEVSLTKAPLLVVEQSAPAETGAIVDFWGVVRATENGREISGINYEAHGAMAEHQLRMVAERVDAAFELTLITIQHRIGFVPAGEASLFVRIGSRHRAEAFRASASVVDELKKSAPIWKHPVFEEATSQMIDESGDGTAEVAVPERA